MRIARHRWKSRRGSRSVVPIDEIADDRRVARRSDQSIEPMELEQTVDAFWSGEAIRSLTSLAIRRNVQIVSCLRTHEDVLAKVQQLPIGLALVEGDDVRQRANFDVRGRLSQIAAQTGLHFALQDLQLKLKNGLQRWIVFNLDELGASAAHSFESGLELAPKGRIPSFGHEASHSHAGASQRIRIQLCEVVGLVRICFPSR
mmetsp:Transcript_115471/g.367212  ORF Transcript_115471/g.367212 Transcript_115471/m.367212 type:complete len:202 (+) Transcript_115471:436-1041(+)